MLSLEQRQEKYNAINYKPKLEVYTLNELKKLNLDQPDRGVLEQNDLSLFQKVMLTTDGEHRPPILV